jgi:hypothetical protein
MLNIAYLFSRSVKHRVLSTLSLFCLVTLLVSGNLAHAYIHLGHDSGLTTASTAGADIVVYGAKCVAGTVLITGMTTAVSTVTGGLLFGGFGAIPAALMGLIFGLAGGTAVSCPA